MHDANASPRMKPRVAGVHRNGNHAKVQRLQPVLGLCVQRRSVRIDIDAALRARLFDQLEYSTMFGD